MSNSVGKISIDMEVQGDLNKQINEMANNLGRQMKASMQSMIKASLGNMEKETKASLGNMEKETKASTAAVSKAMQSAMNQTVEKVKQTVDSMNKEIKDGMERSVKQTEKSMQQMGASRFESIRRSVRALLDSLKVKNTVQVENGEDPDAGAPSEGDAPTGATRGPPTTDSSQVIKLKNQIEETRQKADKLRQELELLGGSKVPTQEYQELEKCIAGAERQLASLLEKQIKLDSLGVSKSGTQYKRMIYDIEEARNTLRAFKIDMANLKESGGAFTPGSGTDNYAIKQSQLSSLINKLDSYKAKLSEVQVEEQNASKGTNKHAVALRGIKRVCERVNQGNSRLGRSFGGLIRKMKQVIFHANGTKRALSGIRGGARSTGRSMLNLGYMFKLLLMNMVLLGVIKGVKEGFQNLVQYSEPVNASISMLMSALTQLKNSFATAFAPILEIIAPIITRFIYMLSDAITFVGMFFAALTGKSSFTKAIKVNQNYAKSLNTTTNNLKDTNKEAEKLQGTLAHFDQAQVLFKESGSNNTSSPTTDNSNSGPDPSQMFDDVKIDSRIKKMADKFKDLFSKILDPFKKAWDTNGQAVMSAWKRALTEIRELATDVGSAWLKVWTNGTGYIVVSNILLLLREIGLWIGDIANAFRTAWNDNGLGLSVIQSMLDAFNNVLTLLCSIGKAFRTAWNDNGLGQAIASNILMIFKNVFDVIGNLSSRLQLAWEKNEVGKEIIATILRMFNDWLTYLKEITKATAEWAANIDFTPILTSISNLLSAIAPLQKACFDGLSWFYSNVLLPLASWTIENVIPAFLDILSGAISIVNGVLVALKPLALWLFKNFLLPIAKWTGGVIVTVLQAIGTGLAAISNWITKNQKLIETIVIIVGSFAAAWQLVNLAVASWNIIAGIGQAITIGFATAVAILQSAIAFLTSPIGIAVVAIGTIIAIGVLLVRNWDWVKEKAGQVWDWIKEKFIAFRDFMSGIFEKDWTETFGVMGIGLNTFFETVSSIWEAVKRIFGGFINFVKGVFTGDWKKAWGGIKDIFGGIWDAMMSFVKAPINGIIGFVNAMLTAIAAVANAIADILNSIQIDIPDWVPLFGGKSFGFNIPHWNPEPIPYLAKGGIVDSPTLAMVGEAGKEAVMPLEHNTGWLDDLAARVALKIDGSGNNGNGGGLTKNDLDAAVSRLISAMGSPQLNINANGSLGELVRHLKLELEKEGNRSGFKLIQSRGVT